MKLTHAAPALVTVKLDARTAADHRMRRLDTAPMLRKVLASFGGRVEHADADGKLYAKGLACGHTDCGTDWNDLGAHPAMHYDSRGANYPGSPEYVHCTVCGYSRETASRLFERLCTKGRTKALDTWPITRLPEIDFTAVRHGDKKAIGESFRSTAPQVAPKRLDLDRDIEAVLIRAPDLRTASEALRQGDFPEDAWTVVPVTHELTPRARWHDQPMTATDSAPIRAHEKQRQREAEVAVAAEVEKFRAELQAERSA